MTPLCASFRGEDRAKRGESRRILRYLETFYAKEEGSSGSSFFCGQTEMAGATKNQKKQDGLLAA